MRLLMVLALGALGSACAADQPCCDSRLTLGVGSRYRALIPNPDGGESTRAEFVLTTAPSGASPGVVTVTFTSGGREVSQTFSAAQRY